MAPRMHRADMGHVDARPDRQPLHTAGDQLGVHGSPAGAGKHVQRLALVIRAPLQGPLKAETGVRFPLGAPRFQWLTRRILNFIEYPSNKYCRTVANDSPPRRANVGSFCVQLRRKPACRKSALGRRVHDAKPGSGTAIRRAKEVARLTADMVEGVARPSEARGISGKYVLPRQAGGSNDYATKTFATADDFSNDKFVALSLIKACRPFFVEADAPNVAFAREGELRPSPGYRSRARR
jgi:hypothetical protein